MHKELEDLPVSWGGMTMGYQQVPAGTDVSALLKGLPDEKCPCPHWGYVVKGSIHIGYADGTEEVIRAGEVFYMPAGHTGWTDEDVAFIELSPEGEYREVMKHIERRQRELSQGSE